MSWTYIPDARLIIASRWTPSAGPNVVRSMSPAMGCGAAEAATADEALCPHALAERATTAPLSTPRNARLPTVPDFMFPSFPEATFDDRGCITSYPNSQTAGTRLHADVDANGVIRGE